MAEREGENGVKDTGEPGHDETAGVKEKPPIMLPGLIHKDADAIKLFVGQVPKAMNEDDLRPVFEEFGEIFDLAVIRDKVSGLHRGCAFLTYCSRPSADAAIAALHGQRRLQRAQNPLQVRPAEGQAEQENKLFVGMAPKSADEDDIRAVFSPYGTIREIHVIRNQDGSNKGCAFVKFTTRESALRAIEDLHENYTMKGGPRPLVVKFADNKRGGAARRGEAADRAGGGGGASTDSGTWPFGALRGPGGAQYAYTVQSPAVTSHMMTMPYLHYGGGTPPGSYVYYPYVQGFSSSSQSGGGGGFSGPPSPGPGGYGGGPGHAPPRTPERGLTGDASLRGGKRGASGRPAEGPPGANLFIYHLPQDLSDADLATAFAPFGHVLSAKVYVDRASGESKGFGFVSYTKPEHANAAIAQMNGFQIGSKRLKVQHKRKMQLGGESTGGTAGAEPLHSAPSHQPLHQQSIPHNHQHHQHHQQTYMVHQGTRYATP
ncbi:unnamed protein product [Discosporangium mesarthrocarpum]